jgi:predicted nucleic acid-binding protein
MKDEVPIVLYDANVLFPFHVGHLLTFVAVKRVVAAKWTREIQREWIENFGEKFPDEREGCARRCAAMNKALPDAMVEGYEHRIANVDFKDPDDRHVIAAALEAGCVAIVTRDKDFAAEELTKFGLSRIDPDDLLIGCFDRFPMDCKAVVEAARASLTRSNPSWEEYLDALEGQGLCGFVRRLRTTDRGKPETTGHALTTLSLPNHVTPAKNEN